MESEEQVQLALEGRGVELSLDEARKAGEFLRRVADGEVSQGQLERMADGELTEDELEEVAGGLFVTSTLMTIVGCIFFEGMWVGGIALAFDAFSKNW